MIGTEDTTQSLSEPRRFPANRYIFESPLWPQRGRHIDTAIDRMLNRRVSVVTDSTADGHALIATAKALAARNSSHLVDIYACGDDGRFHFVVFERPSLTMASLAHDPAFIPWSEVEAARVMGELDAALADLSNAGVRTSTIQLGSVGIDGLGHLRLSPWPLEVGDQSHGPFAEPDALRAAVLRVGLRRETTPDASLVSRYVARATRTDPTGVAAALYPSTETVRLHPAPISRDASTKQLSAAAFSRAHSQLMPPATQFGRRPGLFRKGAVRGALIVVALSLTLAAWFATESNSNHSAGSVRQATTGCQALPSSCPNPTSSPALSIPRSSQGGSSAPAAVEPIGTPAASTAPAAGPTPGPAVVATTPTSATTGGSPPLPATTTSTTTTTTTVVAPPPTTTPTTAPASG